MNRKEADSSVHACAKALRAMFTKAVYNNGVMRIQAIKRDIIGIVLRADSSIGSPGWSGANGFEVKVSVLHLGSVLLLHADVHSQLRRWL